MAACLSENNMSIRQITDFIVIHCSATRPSQNIGAIDIDCWHRERGFSQIGYHFVITRDGTLEKGRDLELAGSHVKGFNQRSIGICLVGGINEEDHRAPENNFTGKQFATLEFVLKDLRRRYPKAVIIGHHDLNPLKACPSFSVKEWIKGKSFS